MSDRQSHGAFSAHTERSMLLVWRENLLQAFEVIKTHRLRSGLLMLGVAIGVMTVLGMVAVLAGLGKKVNEDIISASRPYLNMSRYDPMKDNDWEEVMRRKRFTAADADAIAELCPTVDRVDFQISPGEGMQVLRYQGERTNLIQVVGVSESFPFIFNLKVDEGRFFTEYEVEHRSRVLVLGYGPAKDLFPNRDPIGKWVRVGNSEYEVIGTMESRRSILGGISDNYVGIPYSAMEKDLSSPWDDYQIAWSVKEGHTLEESKEEVTALMRARRKVPPGAPDDFYIVTSESFKEMLGRITGAVGLVLVVISSIGLMVGGIGVMNIMLISVTERTREVGVRMALGARRTDILQQFLIEAATLTGAGGIIGIILGLAAARGVTNLIHFPYVVPVVWVIVAFVFSAGIGIVFGLYPANRAAKMDPVEALRAE